MQRPRVAVVGCAGRLGAVLCETLGDRAEPVGRGGRVHRADIVIDVAGYNDVDGCEADPMRGRRDNVEAVMQRADEARRAGRKHVYVSTDFVFGGRSGDEPYTVDDRPCPVNEYGRQKAEAERIVLDAGGYVVRTAWLYGGRRVAGRPLFLDRMHEQFVTMPVVCAVADSRGNPTPVHRLAVALAAMVDGDMPRVSHVCGDRVMSRYEMARDFFAHLPDRQALRCADVVPVMMSQYRTRAERPRNSALVPTVAVAYDVPQYAAEYRPC